MLMLAKTGLMRASGSAAAAAGHSNLLFRSAQTNNTSQSTYTFTSLAIGTAAADRWVIVAFGAVQGQFPTSVTIGGVTATVVPTIQQFISLWTALVPTGTTATIAVDVAEFGCGIAYWTVNMASDVVFDHDSGGSGLGAPSATIDIPANGFAVTASFVLGATTDATHTIDSSFTERAESYVNTSSFDGNLAYSDREVTTAVSAVTVTSTWSVSDSAYMVIASWN